MNFSRTIIYKQQCRSQPDDDDDADDDDGRDDHDDVDDHGRHDA